MRLLHLFLLTSALCFAAPPTAHLPRPTLLRAGAGASEAGDASVLLLDTVRVGARVALPAGAGAALLFKPAASSAAIVAGAFVADVAGDYLVAAPPHAAGDAPASPPSLCGGAPAATNETTTLRVAAWDFASADTLAGVFLRDAFAHGGVASSETAFGVWAATPPACADEAAGGGLELRGACSLATAAAAVNPFQEPLLIALHGAAPPSGGRVVLALRDAYSLIEAPANLSLGLSVAAYELRAWTGSAMQSLAAGSLASVCSGGGDAFDVALNISAASVTFAISCAGGAGTPATHTLPQPLNYIHWGRGASGAMRLALIADGGGGGGVARAASVSAATLRVPSEPLSETAPIKYTGLFARPALGASQPRALIGVIDVSAQPFAVDKTGATDVTTALEAALYFCYTYALTCFFPVGTYSVSDTLELVQTKGSSGVVNSYDHRFWPFTLQGERLAPAAAARAAESGSPTRATIALAPRSPGFTDASTGKPVIWLRNFIAVGEEAPNSCFNNVFASIDLTIGEGNVGAVGLGWRGAQGTSLEDVTVFAGDGAIGVWGLPGSGGAHSNLTVIGGRFGIDGQGSQPGPSLSALRIVNCSCAGLLYSGIGPLTLVGAAFELASGVPAILAGLPLPISNFTGACTLPVMANPQMGTPGRAGGLSLVDARLDFWGGGAAGADAGADAGAAAIVTSAALVLSRVFFTGLFALAALSAGPSGTGASLGCGASGCALAVARAAFGGDDLAGGATAFRDPIYIGGDRTSSSNVSNATAFLPGAPPKPAFPSADELLAAHSYGARDDFPSFEWLAAGRAVCVWDTGAVGDGFADDSAALQRAIDAASQLPGRAVVVVPRGMHNTSVGLVVPEGVALVGVGRLSSVIHATLAGVARGRATDAGYPPAVVYAAHASAAATGAASPLPPPAPRGAELPLGTVLASLSIYTFTSGAPAGALVFSAGAGGARNNLWRQAFAMRVNAALSTAAAAAAADPAAPPPPAVEVNAPLIVIGASDAAVAAPVGVHLQVVYQDTDSAGQGPDYRHMLVAGARGGVRGYQVNLEHAMSDAEVEVSGGAADVDFFGSKSERNNVFLWARNASGVRVWSYGGNACAYAYNESAATYFGPRWSRALPSLFRLEACSDCLLANTMDMARAVEGSPLEWDGMGVDARVWHMTVWRAAPGPETNASSWRSTEFLDRPALFTT